MGPTLNNLDNLLRLPFGCGEQNMIHFAPNVFVLKYLQKTKQLSHEVESEATDYLVQGNSLNLKFIGGGKAYKLEESFVTITLSFLMKSILSNDNSSFLAGQSHRLTDFDGKMVFLICSLYFLSITHGLHVCCVCFFFLFVF